MNFTNNSILKAVIIVPLALFAIFSIFMMNFAFGYLNQSSLTPKEEQLTFWNYLLPLILTVGFIAYFAVDKIRSEKIQIKRNWILIIGLVISALIAIPWQIQNLNWQIESDRFDLFETSPYFIAIIFTVWTIINKIKKNGTQHSI